MSNHREELLDQQIKGSMQSALEKIDVPPVQVEWEKFEAKYGSLLFEDIEREQYLADLIEKNTPVQKVGNPTRAKRFPARFIRNVAVACILIAILTVTIAKPQKAAAMGEWLLEFFRFKTGDTTENIQRYQGTSGQQNEGYQEIKPIEASLEEVQRISPFKIGIPGILPDNMLERKISYQQMYDVFSVKIEYCTTEGKTFMLKQQNIKGDAAYTKGNDTDDSMTKTIQINGNEALLFEYKNNFREIVWDSNSVLYELRGELSAEELIRIAQSIE